MICAQTGRDLTEEAERSFEAFEAADAALERTARAQPPPPDFSVRAGLRSCGWQARSDVENAVEWLEFDFAYAANASDASVRHNVVEEYGWQDFGDKSILITDTRGFDVLAMRLAERVCRRGDAKLNHIVSAVDASGMEPPSSGSYSMPSDESGEAQAPSPVTVRCTSGESFAARRVIVTASVGVLQSALITSIPSCHFPC